MEQDGVADKRRLRKISIFFVVGNYLLPKQFNGCKTLWKECLEL